MLQSLNVVKETNDDSRWFKVLRFPKLCGFIHATLPYFQSNWLSPTFIDEKSLIKAKKPASCLLTKLKAELK